AGVIVWVKRLLNPEQTVGLEQAGTLQRGLGIPSEADIQHEVVGIADGLPDRLNVAEVGCGIAAERLPTKLDPGMAGVDRTLGAFDRGVDSELEHVGGI